MGLLGLFFLSIIYTINLLINLSKYIMSSYIYTVYIHIKKKNIYINSTAHDQEQVSFTRSPLLENFRSQIRKFNGTP